jgi:hypothetical protein
MRLRCVRWVVLVAGWLGMGASGDTEVDTGVPFSAQRAVPQSYPYSPVVQM